MLPFESSIIDVINEGYEAGFNLPEKFLPHQTEDIPPNSELFINDPLTIVKPVGFEFTYMVFWDGRKFRGGYISINNNYSGVQRGMFARNGETLFAGHVITLRKRFKNICKKDNPRWVCKAFILSESGKIFYWGNDIIDYYSEQLKVLTGSNVAELEDKFLSGEKTFKPAGFVSSILIKSVGTAKFIHTGNVSESISKSWHSCYGEAEKLDKGFYYTLGVDNYIRKAYRKMMEKNIIK